MYRYALLNVVILVPVLYVLYRTKLPKKRLLLLLAGMSILTAVFDSLLISLELFGYYTEHISGLYIGKAPIEDFAYTLAAVILVPALWRYFGNERNGHEEHS